ncbi:MAG: hypothetical protein P0120_17100 [Nitrospira sp.]|nr:hypothetical protein [Nitrospira sp.]
MVFAAIIVRVHGALEQLDSDCSMEELVTLCPELTWNQAFLAIDYLSRNGQVRVTLDGDRTYRVQAHRASTVEASPSASVPDPISTLLQQPGDRCPMTPSQ